MAEDASQRAVILETPIQRGDTAIAELIVRKPSSGELRGLSLVDLGQLDVDALHTVLPRITIPTITRQEAQALEPADLMALGAEVAGFLLPKAKRPDFLAS